MQLTLLSVAAAMVATVSAEQKGGDTAAVLYKNFLANPNVPHARVINRCDYDVYLWSVYRNMGCSDKDMFTLKAGESYAEKYQEPEGGDTGVSIKISKTTQCTGSNIVQLEYFLEKRNDDLHRNYHANFLDVSYVDCLGGDCPTKKEGYYLAAGNQTARAEKATADNSWCPILACHDPASCAKMSYILPDDVQTKTCGLDDSMEFYMCGSQPPSEDDEKPAYSAPAYSAPAPSSKQPETPTPKPTPTEAPSSSADGYKIDIAAVTPPAQLKDEPKEPKIKTKTVVVTAYEYVNAKRSEHVHRHARRHQSFHA